MLIPASVDTLLRIWASFMKRGGVGKGYPAKSAGMSSGGINCWDDLEDCVDSATASSVNAALCDLSPMHYCAISNHYCAKVWKFRGEDHKTLMEAIGDFVKKAKARGLLFST